MNITLLSLEEGSGRGSPSLKHRFEHLKISHIIIINIKLFNKKCKASKKKKKEE